jgi:hypothetical protein
MFNRSPTIPTNPRTPYQSEIEGPQLMYALASIGMVGLVNFVLSFVSKTPMGVAPFCGVLGGLGLLLHGIYAYYSSRVKRSLFWLVWMQSAFLVALTFYAGGLSCQP